MGIRRIHAVWLAVLVLFGSEAAGQTTQASGWTETGVMPGDVVKLDIWREPELSFEQTVPADGIVIFHKLGPYDVRGLGTDELRRTLVADYSRYLVDAEARIRLDVLRKVQISGAVRNPSIYTLHPTLSLSDALAMAGGPLAEGRVDRMELRRDGELVRVLLLSDRAPLADAPIRSGDQLHVPQRSAASRNLGVIASVLTSIFVVTISVLAR